MCSDCCFCHKKEESFLLCQVLSSLKMTYCTGVTQPMTNKALLAKVVLSMGRVILSHIRWTETFIYTTWLYLLELSRIWEATSSLFAVPTRSLNQYIAKIQGNDLPSLCMVSVARESSALNFKVLYRLKYSLSKGSRICTLTSVIVRA